MGAPVPRIEIICQYCGDPFYRMACELKHKPVRFCSAACKYAAKRTGGEKICEECEAAFYAKGSYGHLRFCSRACYHASVKRGSHSYPKIKGRHAHRVVMEEQIGRKLGPDEIVHHDDENILNFDADNLVLTDRSEHARHHFSGRKQSEEHVRKRVESRARTMLGRLI